MEAASGQHSRPRAPVLGFALAAAWALADLLTKARIEAWLSSETGAHWTVTPFLNLALSYNRGVTFGLFSGETAPTLMILAVTGLIALGICVWILRLRNIPMVLSLGLVLGGAIGNIIDRAPDGAVTDFIDFHLAGAHWPAFNLADVGVIVGLGAFVLIDLTSGRRQASAEPRPRAET
jgi:signal peptidase II